MQLAPPPFTVDPPLFPFRALAALAGRAPLGGPRESALAVLVVARLVVRALPPFPFTASVRTARSEAVRGWLTAVPGVSPTLRTALLRLAEATGVDDRNALASALGSVTDITAPLLDRAARSELDRLAQRLAS